jgi:hypothetical protein
MNVKHDIITGQILEETRRERIDVEAIISSIFTNVQDLLSFLLKKTSDGEVVPVSKNDYKDDNGNYISTLKQWIDFVVTKIISESRITSSNSKVESILQWASNELKQLAPLDLSGSEDNRRIFSTESTSGEKSELERGKIMLEIIIQVIGHSTFRDVITHCIKSSGNPEKITIDILNAPSLEDLSDFCTQFSFYPSTFPSEGSGKDSLSVDALSKYKYSLYFDDSVVYLPIEGNVRDQSLNAISLGNVPASFLDIGTLFSENTASELLLKFNALYSTFMKNKFGIHNTNSINQIRSAIFLDSGYEAFKVIKKLLPEVLSKQFKGQEYEHYLDFSELILRAELLFKNLKVRNIKNLRGQLEDVISGVAHELIFHKMNSLVVPIESNKFTTEGANIQAFKSFTRNSYTTEIKNILNEIAIKNRVEVLKDIIKDNGGTMKFFITRDTLGKGVHYLRISETSDQSNYLPQLGTKTRSHIEVDLSKSNSQGLLRKLVILSMSYIPPSGRGYYSRLGLVLTKSDPDTPICILNGDRFLNSNQVYSIPYSTTRHDIYYDLVEIIGFEGKFSITKANTRWQEFNTYFPYDLSQEASELDLF